MKDVETAMTQPYSRSSLVGKLGYSQIPHCARASWTVQVNGVRGARSRYLAQHARRTLRSNDALLPYDGVQSLPPRRVYLKPHYLPADLPYWQAKRTGQL